MTRVKDFIPDHIPSKDVLVIGISPAKRKVKNKPHCNGTLVRLDSWMKQSGQREWSFHNVIPDVAGSCCIHDVDSNALLKAAHCKSVIIALGGFVYNVCARHGIDSFKIDHPSPRNRNFNDAAYEPKVVARLKKFLKSKI